MRKKFILILCLLAVTAFIVRMAVCVELLNFNNGKNAIVVPETTTDMCTYMKLSDLVAKGEFTRNYSHEFYYQPFYYAVFLPIIKILFGSSIWAVIIVQSIIGALTVYTAGIAAAKIWGKNSGFIAAGLLTFSGTLIIYTPFHLIVTLQAFWMTLLFYVSILAIKNRNWKRWSVVGLVYACAVLTRGNVWLFFPGLLICSVFCQFFRKENRHNLSFLKIIARLIPMIAFFICTILPQLPFAAYNSKVRGKLTPPSTAAQNVLALGNTPESPPGGREEGSGPGPMEYPNTYKLWTQDDTSVQEHIWNWFLDEPAAFIELTFRKMLLFWDHQEIPNNISLEFYGAQSNTFTVFGFVQSWLLISLGLAGIVCLFRQNHKKLELQLLIYLIAAYWLSVAAFYILGRFRAPLMPLLSIYGSFFVCYFWKLRKQNFEWAYYFCFPVMFIFFCITFFGYRFYRNSMEADMVKFVRPHGTVIHVNSNEDMVLENGPFTFGGWRYVCFQPGTKVIKTFSKLKNKDYKSVELEVAMIWESPGEATFRINGHKRVLSNSRGGFKLEKFYLPSFPKNEKFIIKLVSATTRVFYYIDVQRNYGRTQIGDFTPPGELVCRLYCSREPLKKFLKSKKKKQENKEKNRAPQGEERANNENNIAMTAI